MIKINPTNYTLNYPLAGGGNCGFKLETLEDINLVTGTGPVDIDIGNMILRDCYITGYIKNCNMVRYEIVGSDEACNIPGRIEVVIEGVFMSCDEQKKVKFKGEKKYRNIWKTDYEKATEILGKLSKVTYEEYERQVFSERI